MKLRLTREALGDLDAISDYLHERNPAAALRVRAELQAALRLLCVMPEAGRQRRPWLRCLHVPRRPYLIFYWPDKSAGELVVFTIRHAARREKN